MDSYYALGSTQAGHFMFTLHAGDHRVILTSEPFSERASAVKGIEAARQRGGTVAAFQRRTSGAAAYHFVLSTPDGTPIGRSALHASIDAMEDNLRSVIANAATPALRHLEGPWGPATQPRPTSWRHTEWSETTFEPHTD